MWEFITSASAKFPSILPETHARMAFLKINDEKQRRDVFLFFFTPAAECVKGDKFSSVPAPK